MTKVKWTNVLIIPIAAIVITLWGKYSYEQEITNKLVTNILVSILYTAGIWLGCMVIVKFLWKKFPWEQKPLWHLSLEIPSIIIYTILFVILMHKLQEYSHLLKYSEDTLRMNISVSVLITLLITSIHEAFFFYKQWTLNFSKSIKLEKDNINSKYEALKAQINPHFLFNSLNSLVTLVDGNEKASTYIMDLSDFLRYMLKSREREVVLVREETEVLTKYINLQKTRFGENLKAEVNIEEKYYHYALPPLVLQMLVENCIKHNVISQARPLLIRLYVKNENIVVENNLQKREDAYSTGNGLKNISERYSYLSAKKIEIKQTNSKFIVSVPIVLIDL